MVNFDVAPELAGSEELRTCTCIFTTKPFVHPGHQSTPGCQGRMREKGTARLCQDGRPSMRGTDRCHHSKEQEQQGTATTNRTTMRQLSGMDACFRIDVLDGGVF